MNKAVVLRRLVVVALLQVVLFMSLFQTDPGRAQVDRRPPPNVLIIFTDDQRDTLAKMGSVRRHFVAHGRNFPRAYATTPACCPSRASIMTGRFAHNHRVTTNKRPRKLNHRTTLQFYLQRAGYRTGYMGKFLNGWPLSQGPPFFHDWAINAPNTTGWRSRYFDGKFNINGAIRRVAQYSTNFIGDQAESFLRRTDRRNDRRPWLLYIAPNAPHPPYQPAREYEDARVPKWNPPASVGESNLRDKPKWVRKSQIGRSRAALIRRQQLRMLMSVDDMTRQVMSTLNDLRERNTLVVYTSDNGYAWGEHGLERKFSPYRESVEIPLMIKWPGQVGNGTVDPRLAANIDIAPTVIDATGASTGNGPPMDGRSLLDPTWQRARLLLEYWKHSVRISRAPTWASMITRSSQYTKYYVNRKVVFREYYDLANDPYQLRNLLGDRRRSNDPATIRPMNLLLEQDRRCEGATCP
ncbi:MAG: sulfatase [Actinomycetota bacterium]|nr:sulfatase [Actinomycetota bacterium]